MLLVLGARLVDGPGLTLLLLGDSTGLVNGGLTTDEVVLAGGGVEVVLGRTVVEGGAQSNPMEWMPTEQVGLGLLGWTGYTTVTFLAPPHWLFFTVVPALEHGARCRHRDPSGMS